MIPSVFEGRRAGNVILTPGIVIRNPPCKLLCRLQVDMLNTGFVPPFHLASSYS